MRRRADAARIRQFMQGLAAGENVEATVYLAGGATAVLLGWRTTTIDVDIRLEPDSDELLRRIPPLKEELELNVELASPLDFLPAPPGWRDRSPLIQQHAAISFRHMDLYAQALSKVERGHAQDQADVEAMLARGLIEPQQALELFSDMEPELYRFPAVDPAGLRRRVETAFGEDAQRPTR